MTVQELGEYWMRRRLEEARAPSTGERRVEDDGLVSLQTLAGYQASVHGPTGRAGQVVQDVSHAILFGEMAVTADHIDDAAAHMREALPG